MINIYEKILRAHERYRQFVCGESLITLYSCGLKNKYEEIWSDYNYIIYVVEGRKIWHTAHGSYDLQEGSCVFVKKGASIVEQFFDAEFCMILFFITDELIYDVLKSKSGPVHKAAKKDEAVFPIENNATIDTFFKSMMLYFSASRDPDQSLLELKFRELILTLADNPANNDLLIYFHSLLREPRAVSLQRVMEDNFYFNLSLEEFARLSSRSLSAFKRDFQRLYHTSPGKWLKEKRLNHSLHLLTNLGKSVSETAFEGGFKNTSHFSRAFRQRFGASPASIKLKTAV